MKTFEYKGFDSAGKVVRGLTEGLSVKHAREQLAASGILAERITSSGRRVRLQPQERAVFYRELSSLLRAGVPLLGALDIMLQSPELTGVRIVLAATRDGIREGRSLAQALSQASTSVGVFETAVVEAGEASGRLPEMLERCAAFLEEQDRVRERVQGALVYPAIVFTVGLVVAILMLGLLLPRAAAVLGNRAGDLPGLTRAMLGMGRGIARGWPVLLVLVFVAVLLCRRLLRRGSTWRLRFDRALFRIPGFGQGYRLLVNMRFARTLAILVGGGVSPIKGMMLAGRATGSVSVEADTETGADRVEHGTSLSDAIQAIGPLSGTLPGWVRVGEASGELERLLDSAARRFEEAWDRFLRRWMVVVEPLLIVLIGGFVLLVTLSVLLPILNLSQALGR
ncbi:MAG: type II secretion system F family protein [Kiritimatiellia bacterium]|jgi:general secretion pathway protein F|nr:type II secretion system F family protein [Kiritimatiellia bacterium]MDP6630724.1 type II secretion system F family protein [Kiritimatiellia bacterium]MDP6809413.1 type II secretion system F family protein [Kiritimatiellia bacterium]MDP7023910.1 type II secretion system F family protein [Kiritimatiellia bacterium]